MTTQELIKDLRSRINPGYAHQLGTESYERRLCVEALEAMQADIDRLRKGAISALAAGGVLIRLSRVEGYEDVCDELLAADAMEGINWPSYEVLTAEEAKGTT